MTYPQSISSNPLSYLGVQAINPPGIIESQRNPQTTDINYPIGQLWINTATNSTYQLNGFSSGTAVWVALGGGSTAVASLAGDSGTATPSSGSITIAGGTNLTSSASGSTVTVNLDSTISGLTSVSSTSFVTSSATKGTTYTQNKIEPTGSDSNINVDISPKGSGAVIYSASKAGVDVNFQATNSDNTNASSDAGFQAAVGGSSAGDPYVEFAISGSQTWTIGADNSASDSFVIAASNTLGTSNAASWSTTGNLTNSGSITATSGSITATDGDLILSAVGKGIQLKTGANATLGSATLTNGTVTVANTSVTASSIIFLSRGAANASSGIGDGLQAVPGSGTFTINALDDSVTPDPNDQSTVYYLIINPAP